MLFANLCNNKKGYSFMQYGDPPHRHILLWIMLLLTMSWELELLPIINQIIIFMYCIGKLIHQIWFMWLLSLRTIWSTRKIWISLLSRLSTEVTNATFCVVSWFFLQKGKKSFINLNFSEVFNTSILYIFQN